MCPIRAMGSQGTEITNFPQIVYAAPEGLSLQLSWPHLSFCQECRHDPSGFPTPLVSLTSPLMGDPKVCRSSLSF